MKFIALFLLSFVVQADTLIIPNQPRTTIKD